jgi:hypothetical protein
LNVKVSAVAPFFTPTRTFSKLSERWAASGLNANTLDEVANTIARVALAPSGGKCVLVLLTLLNMDLGAAC